MSITLSMLGLKSADPHRGLDTKFDTMIYIDTLYVPRYHGNH